MRKYEYGKINVLATRLAEAEVSQGTIDEILSGGESIRTGMSAEKKAVWMRDAMNRMDALLDEPTRRCVRESCACSLGGKRLEISRRIAKKYQTLEERVSAANEAKLVFGDSVTMQDDGRIRVSFFPEEKESYRCVCLPKAREPISVTYCYCCGGHVKHHLQIALDRKLSCTVASSALESGGKSPCTFLFSVEDAE